MARQLIFGMFSLSFACFAEGGEGWMGEAEKKDGRLKEIEEGRWEGDEYLQSFCRNPHA